jgi:hypothetical protein
MNSSDIGKILSRRSRINCLALATTPVLALGAALGVSATPILDTQTVSPALEPLGPAGTVYVFVDVSGEVYLEGNNADIASLQITSASGAIITANWHDLNSNGYSNWTDTAKKATGIGEFDNQFTVSGDYAVINGVIDYGNFYDFSRDAEDYIFKYGSVESNDTTVDTVNGQVYYFPEPTMLGLMSLTAMGLFGRRPKKLDRR